jgi:hypothetical protein
MTKGFARAGIARRHVQYLVTIQSKLGNNLAREDKAETVRNRNLLIDALCDYRRTNEKECR